MNQKFFTRRELIEIMLIEMQNNEEKFIQHILKMPEIKILKVFKQASGMDIQRFSLDRYIIN